MIQDDTTLLSLPRDTQAATQVLSTTYDIDCDWLEMYSEGLTQCSSEFKDNILGHIAGICQRSVLRREKCLDCVEFLNKGQKVSTPLLEIKGGCHDSKVIKWDSSFNYLPPAIIGLQDKQVFWPDILLFREGSSLFR